MIFSQQRHYRSIMALGRCGAKQHPVLGCLLHGCQDLASLTKSYASALIGVETAKIKQTAHIILTAYLPIAVVVKIRPFLVVSHASSHNSKHGYHRSSARKAQLKVSSEIQMR